MKAVHGTQRGEANRRRTPSPCVHRHHLVPVHLLALIAACCLTHCDNEIHPTDYDDLDFKGWLNKPIPISLFQNIPLVQISFEGEPPTTAAIDTATPLMAIMRNGSLERHQGELRLFDTQVNTVTRFIFYDIDVFDLSLQPVGLDDKRSLGGLIGASLLRILAFHLSYHGQPSFKLMDEIPDTNRDLAADCDADLLATLTAKEHNPCLGVIPMTISGGGLMRVGKEYFDLPATRLTFPMCLQPEHFDPQEPANPDGVTISGVPTRALLATGMGTSIISRSAFTRLKAFQPTMAISGSSTLYLPNGSEQVERVTIDRLAFVSDETLRLQPCAELLRRRRMVLLGEQGLPEDERELGNGASVTYLAQPMSFIVLDDEKPLWQALNNELQPYTSEIDVIIGGDVLQSFEVDVDYPGSRLILQCVEDQPSANCQILPWCGYSEDPYCPGAENL